MTYNWWGHCTYDDLEVAMVDVSVDSEQLLQYVLTGGHEVLKDIRIVSRVW